jgi:hypothetical protein
VSAAGSQVHSPLMSGNTSDASDMVCVRRPRSSPEENAAAGTTSSSAVLLFLLPSCDACTIMRDVRWRKVGAR